jgi:hypothetical protein
MRNGRLTCCLLWPVALLGPGCQVFQDYRPVAVVTQDAETCKPIPGAEVRLSYPLTDSPFRPRDAFGTTGPDGVARLEAMPPDDPGFTLSASARGYLLEETDLPADAIAAAEPAGLFRSANPRPARLVVNLYAEPGPTVELIVPGGYHGLVKAEFRVQDDAPGPPGQRCFTYTVPPSGRVTVAGPRLLRRVFPPDFRFRYADGQPLTPEAKGSPVGYWWLKSDGRDQCFVVATGLEYDAYRREEEAQEAGTHTSPGGQSRGRGRHGRHGDPAADQG